MKSRKIPVWLALGILAIGVVPVALLGLYLYTTATAEVLHQSPEDVPSVTRSAPSKQLAGAVERARQVVREGISELNLPGLSVAVGVGGDVVWAEGFGWADLESRAPVAPETRFRIGTASIALTSVATGLLLEQERLKLDEKVQTYVPEFTEKQWPVTLRQVMGHTAGIRGDGGDEAPLTARCGRPVEGLAPFNDSDLRFEPGTQYRFSGFSWILVSAAVEAAAGESFDTFMREKIFEPADMMDTRPDSADVPVSNRATFYFPRFAADPKYGLHGTGRIDYSCYSGASVFLSTPSDLVRFGLAVNSGKLLQRATVQLLQTSQRLPSGEETGYGLGWDVETVDLAGAQTRWVGHDGITMGGMVASLMMFPERGLVISVMSNIAHADTESLALKIAQAFAAPAR